MQLSHFQLAVFGLLIHIVESLRLSLAPHILNRGWTLPALTHTQADCGLPAQREMVASQSN